MLYCHDIEKSFQGDSVLHRVSFGISSGERVGLVGENGSGKTTLLRIIARVLTPDAGHVQLDSGIRMGYVPQEYSGDQNAVVRDFLSLDTPGAETRLAWDLLHALQFPEALLFRAMGALSGGERRKVLLVAAFAKDCDLYLLDEPTNDLDLDGIVLLERFLQTSRAALLVISHDRRFLDALVTRVLALDPHTHRVLEYPGNFSSYLKLREEQLLQAWAEYHERQSEVQRLRSAVATEKAWAKRGNDHPRVTDNDKMLRGFMQDRSKGLAQKAKALSRRLERLPEVEKPWESLPQLFSLDEGERSGDRVFVLDGVLKRLSDGRTLGPIDLTVTHGERIAIIGPNGAGKTTLLRLLRGEITPDAGCVREGSRVTVGFLPQDPIRDAQETPLSFLRASGRVLETSARELLNRFGLPRAQAEKPIAMLSPGMRSRLVLVRCMAEAANTLLLDEPSNHLDLDALMLFERALADFTGTVVCVTHDRYFLERFRPTAVYEVTARGELLRRTNVI